MNHPALTGDREFLAELTEIAVNKPSNSDIATVPQAAFVAAFERVLGDPALPHLFLRRSRLGPACLARLAPELAACDHSDISESHGPEECQAAGDHRLIRDDHERGSAGAAHDDSEGRQDEAEGESAARRGRAGKPGGRVVIVLAGTILAGPAAIIPGHCAGSSR